MADAPNGHLEEPKSGLLSALASLRYAYPSTVFAYYLLSSLVILCTTQKKPSGNGPVRRNIIQCIILFGVLTYVFQLSNLLVFSLREQTNLFSQDLVIGSLSCILVFGIEWAHLSDSESPNWYPYIGSYFIALIYEAAIDALSILTQQGTMSTYVQLLDIATSGARYLSCIVILAVYYSSICFPILEKGTDAECQPLIPGKDDVSGENTGEGQQEGQQNYGATSNDSKNTSKDKGKKPVESPWERRQRQAKEKRQAKLEENGNWLKYAKSFLVRDKPLGCY
jgi:hypothetical protein